MLLLAINALIVVVGGEILWGEPRPRAAVFGRRLIAVAGSRAAHRECYRATVDGLLKLIRWVAGIGGVLLILYVAFRFLRLMH